MSEASSVPMSALTAWQAIFEKGQLVSPTYSMHSLPHISQDGEGEGELVSGQAEGKRVLVLGAAGGVGVFACQFAKVAGAYVVGTASQVNDGFVRGLGVDGVVDYRRESMREWVGGDEVRWFLFSCPLEIERG
jgi:NADPH:quinone reductase-like Zn-dependent oxidoreductase